ncbi:hypothetical protein O988_08535 [Pseudogymnoascus sp. VKM F-3808]|nr:hypothetical protein O988_08535 [Pseudogymnoascus sp. VKM F-3808]
MLAERAAKSPDLKALMRIVADGKATPAELRRFQTHIDELTKALNARGGPPKSQPSPAPPPPLQTQQPPMMQQSPMGGPHQVQPKWEHAGTPPLPPHAQRQGGPPPLLAQPRPGYDNKPLQHASPYGAAPQPQALRSKGPVSNKPDLSCVVFEFVGACYDEVVDGSGTPARESGESGEAAGGGEEVDGWGDGGDDEGGVRVTRHATAPGAEHWGSREGTREGIEEGGGEGERGEERDWGGRGAVEYERESGEWRAESQGAAEGVVGGGAVSKFYTDGQLGDWFYMVGVLWAGERGRNWERLKDQQPETGALSSYLCFWEKRHGDGKGREKKGVSDCERKSINVCVEMLETI